MDSTDAISVTGLTAASTQLQVSASNVANVDDTAPLPGSGVAGPAPFVPTRVETVSLGWGGGLAQLSAAQPTRSSSSAPDNPYADSQGMVATPNVDLANEAVSQMQAAQLYQSSAAVLKANDKMQRMALHMLA